MTPTRSRKAFLRWLLVNVLFALGLAVAAVSYHGRIHPAGLIAAGAVLAVYALASGYCGVLAWRETFDYDEHLVLAINACPMIAMLGTISGFLIAFSGSLEDVQQRVLGASSGLTATFVGISAMLTLKLLRHLLPR